MKKLAFRLACFIALTLCAIPSHSATDFLREIARLYNAGQADKAYALAEKHVLEAEGDPDFDAYYGMAALDSGHFSQGVFALERLLMLQPENHRIRLELARGYFLLEDYSRARREFQRVLDSNPPKKVQANIQHFLDLIRLRESRYRTTAGFYLEFGGGYDSNANSAPSAANFESPLLGPGTLSGSSLSQEDSYISYAVGGNIVHPIKPGISLFGRASATRRNYDEVTDFDLGSLNAEGGITLLHESDRFQLRLQAQNYDVGHDRYRELHAISGDWRRQLNPQTQLTGFARYANLNFPANGLYDSRLGMAGLGLLHSYDIRWKPMPFASLYGGKEKAREDSSIARYLVDRDIYGLRFGAHFSPNVRLNLNISALLQESRYDESNIIFARKREDEYRSLSLGATWLLDPRWSIHGNLSYSENDSNIPIYRYYRTETGLTVRYEY